MPATRKRVPAFKPANPVEVAWDNFSGGWNSIFKPTELKPSELNQADNLMLVGKGVPTGRWGSQMFHMAGSTGRVRLLDAFYIGGGAASMPSTNYLLSITDQGYLTKKSGASYTIIPGASFASGQNYQSVEIANSTYIAAGQLPFIKFNGASLIPYTPLGVVTNVSVAQLSAASGLSSYSWLVTAISQTGETLGSQAKILASLPLDLTLTSIRVGWNTISAASGTLTGYNVYRGFPGAETYLASVDPATTQYIDTGTDASDIIFPPFSDTTGGPKAKYIIKFDDRLILSGIAGDPSLVLISARYPYHDRFTAADGGGYARVSPDDGDEVKGLGIAGNQAMGSPPPDSAILVLKGRSVIRITLNQISVGNFVILDPKVQTLTSSNGCSSADTVVAMENDVVYFGRKGMYTVGQEPNFLNQIRTNELSARIRPNVRSLSDRDFTEAAAGYMDNKYLLSFPTLKETWVYDRERACFMGPWKTPFGITKWLKYYDTDGTERWLAGSDTGGAVQEFNASYISDSGTAIQKQLRTKKEDFGDWGIMKVINLVKVLFRNITGSVTVNFRIEERSGNTVTTKSFTLTSSLGNGGWGGDQWGLSEWGTTSATVSLSGDELVRWAQLYKQARVIQVEVGSTTANDNWEFLGVRMSSQPLGPSSLPSATRV